MTSHSESSGWSQRSESSSLAAEWLGPPEGELPIPLVARVVVFRTERAVLTLDHLSVFSTGIGFTLNVWARRPADIRAIPWEPHGPDGALRPDFLRLGFEFADGGSWTNQPTNFDHFRDRPTGPLLLGRGGGGTPSFWSMKQWLWPLPPPDVLRIHAAWPKYDVDDTSVELDSSEFPSAAARADDVWRT